MKLQDNGCPLYDYAVGVATHSFTPKQDREADVTNIIINTVSANDFIRFTVGGKTIIRLPISADVERNLFIGNLGDVNTSDTIFSMVKRYLNRDMSIPVPQGDTLVVFTEGGATFDTFIEYEEYTPGSLNNAMVNNWHGANYLIPVAAHRVANVTAIGDAPLDTSVAPDWAPDLFINTPFRAGWMARVLMLFTTAAGVNTFSGAANHQSRTEYLFVEKNGTQLFGRNASGIPLLGIASGAGSANAVLDAVYSRYPKFSNVLEVENSILDTPWTFTNGDTLEVALHVTGDVTGGASYTNAYLFALAEFTKIQG